MASNSLQNIEQQRKKDVQQQIDVSSFQSYEKHYEKQTQDVLDDIAHYREVKDKELFVKHGWTTDKQQEIARTCICNALQDMIVQKVDSKYHTSILQMKSPVELLEFYLMYDEVQTGVLVPQLSDSEKQLLRGTLQARVFDIKNALSAVKDPRLGEKVAKDGVFEAYEKLLIAPLEMRGLALGRRVPELGRRYGQTVTQVIQSLEIYPSLVDAGGVINKTKLLLGLELVREEVSTWGRIQQISPRLGSDIKKMLQQNSVQLSDVFSANPNLAKSSLDTLMGMRDAIVKLLEKHIVTIQEQKNIKLRTGNAKGIDLFDNQISMLNSLKEEIEHPLLTRNNVNSFSAIMQEAGVQLDHRAEELLQMQIDSSEQEIAANAAKTYIDEHALDKLPSLAIIDNALRSIENQKNVCTSKEHCERQLKDFRNFLRSGQGKASLDKRDTISLSPGNYFYFEATNATGGIESHYDVITKVTNDGIVFRDFGPMSFDQIFYHILATERGHKHYGNEKGKTKLQYALNTNDLPLRSLHDVKNALSLGTGINKVPGFEKGGVLKKLQVDKSGKAKEYLWDTIGTIKGESGNGIMLETGGKKKMMSFPELYLALRDGKNGVMKIDAPGTETQSDDAAKWNAVKDIQDRQGKMPSVNYLAIVQSVKDIFSSISDEYKRKLEMEGHLSRMMILNLPIIQKDKGIFENYKGGLAGKARDAMLDMENKKVTKIKDKLDKKEDAAKEGEIDKFFDRYMKYLSQGLDVTKLSRSFDKTDGKKAYDHRAELKGHLFYILETYGTLYPTNPDPKKFPYAAKARENKFWLQIFSEGKENAANARKKSIADYGEDDGEIETSRLIATFRTQPLLFGDEAANKVESALSSGAGENKKKIGEEIKKSKSKDQIIEKAYEFINKNRFDGIEDAFIAIIEKGGTAQEVYELFHTFYKKIRLKDPSGTVRSHFPFEKMKDTMKTIGNTLPYPFFKFLVKSENFRKLDNLLSSPPIASAPVEQHWKMLNLAGDHSLLKGYASIKNEYIAFIREEIVKGPGSGPYILEHHDNGTWIHNPLLSFNPNVIGHLASEISEAGDLWKHGNYEKYFESLVSSVESLENDTSIEQQDKDEYLLDLRGMLYDLFYNSQQFSFDSQTGPEKNKADWYGKFKTPSSFGSGNYPAPYVKRDNFFDKYNKNMRLEKLRLDPKWCYLASEMKKGNVGAPDKYTYDHNDKVERGHIPMNMSYLKQKGIDDQQYMSMY